jgi:sulfotransferase family protein
VFIFSSIRSGSTLLRCLLNTHTRIHAPHELHLLGLQVGISGKCSQLAMRTAGLNEQELEHLLWDRVLHAELIRSHKDVIVDKTPANVLQWKRIAKCWPNARYIFLLRHPAQVTESTCRAYPGWKLDDVVHMIQEFLEALLDAWTNLPGLTVRYEEMVENPARITREICSFLYLPWEESMLDYGRADHGPLIPGIGDWSAKIRSGYVQPQEQLQQPLHPVLVTISHALGYDTNAIIPHIERE